MWMLHQCFTNASPMFSSQDSHHKKIFSFERELICVIKSFKVEDFTSIPFDNAREKTNVDNLFYVAPTQTDTENLIKQFVMNNRISPMIPFYSQSKRGKDKRGAMQIFDVY
jgi:hypothetical protein